MLEVCVFHRGPDGLRLVGTTSNPELVQRARECLAAERRREAEELEGGQGSPLRPLPSPDGEPGS